MNFRQIRLAAKKKSRARVAVPMGHDPASLEALLRAVEEDIATAVVLAPSVAVQESLLLLGRTLPGDIETIDIEDPEKAALEAVRLVHCGEASILMKGMIKTGIFQKAILDREVGLRTGALLSHVAVVHVPRQDRLVAISDGGMNIRPDADAIHWIAINAAGVIMKLGADEPRVALLAAVENKNPAMPETVLFAEIARKGIPGLAIEGPIAVDGAIDPEAATAKNMHGPVAGKANVLVVPDIASGNIFVKSFMYMTDAEVGGIIAGAAAPIVMLSRSDRPRAKLNSLALGVIVSEVEDD